MDADLRTDEELKASTRADSESSKDAVIDAAEFERLSRESAGNSDGWKFNREELH